MTHLSQLIFYVSTTFTGFGMYAGYCQASWMLIKHLVNVLVRNTLNESDESLNVSHKWGIMDAYQAPDEFPGYVTHWMRQTKSPKLTTYGAQRQLCLSENPKRSIIISTIQNCLQHHESIVRNTNFVKYDPLSKNWSDFSSKQSRNLLLRFRFNTNSIYSCHVKRKLES